MIHEILTKEDFHEAVRNGDSIVITDKGQPPRFHPSAQSCDHVTLDYFMEKVLVNQRRNGGYFSVGSRAEAERRWPSLADCYT